MRIKSSKLASVLISGILLALLGLGVQGDYQVNCQFYPHSWHLWPMHTVCQVTGANLSIGNSKETFKFSGTEQEKAVTKTLYFLQSSLVEFLPVSFLTELPNVNGLIIHSLDWPIVKTGIFTKHFKRIEHLYLDQSKIKVIEGNAFAELTELRWIALWNNQIEYLKRETFQYNLKMEYINFNQNGIKRINPRFFDHLTKLVELNFANNFCVNKVYNMSTSTLAEVKLGFQECFESCRLDENCNPPLDDFKVETDKKFNDLSGEIFKLKTLEKDHQTRLEKLEAGCVSKVEFQEFSKKISEELEKLLKDGAEKIGLVEAQIKLLRSDIQEMRDRIFTA